ncbi:MAG: ammonium transporter, partial [Bacteroidales bacterium]|nr:ammonium transporter [Bacteroidales bacterium]
IWAAAVIGGVVSLVMCMSVSFIDKVMKVDDPVGAVSVHGVGGLLGTIFVGVFSNDAYGVETSVGVQALGAVVVALFAFGVGMLLFTVIKKTHGLRCDKRIEEEGLDVYEHGESCYNN